eukprot:scaffold858_cov123-Cylindrotheca_fusiformis.AAC.48
MQSITGIQGMKISSSPPAEHAISPNEVTPCPSEASYSSSEAKDVISPSRLGSLELQDKPNVLSSDKVSDSDCSAGRSHSSSPQEEQQQRQPVSSPPAVRSAALSIEDIRQRRERFLIFVKILFKCLADGNDAVVCEKAKRIVRECTRKNRMGDPKFASLFEATSSRLRSAVGESLWRRSVLLLHHFMAKRKTVTAAAAG